MPEPRACATCDHWRPYIPGLGECLEYVKRRQEAFVRASDWPAFHAQWPARPAPDTEPTDSCEHYALAEDPR